MSNLNNSNSPLLKDSIILTGGVDLLRSTLPIVLAIRQMLQDKDIGEIVCDTLIDSVKKVVAPNIVLNIIFYSNQKPPFTRKGYKRVVAKIPHVRKSSLKWETIKAACGGINGYMGGRFRATANLSTGRQMQVFGGTEKEATQQLTRLQKLSESKITTLTCSEMKGVGYGAKGDILYKDAARMYPAYCTIINTEKIQDELRREKQSELLAEKQKTKSSLGLFTRVKTRKIPLWTDKAPDWFTEEVNEAFLNRGRNSDTE